MQDLHLQEIKLSYFYTVDVLFLTGFLPQNVLLQHTNTPTVRLQHFSRHCLNVS